MAVSTMAKKRQGEEIPQPDPAGEEKESTLKVWQSDQQIVAKIAAHRGLTIKEFFREKDVRTFLKHLLIAEMKKEAQRLEDQP